MVLFFIADLTLTLAFKLSAWCLGKTYNGIVYLLTTSKPQKSNPSATEDNEDDCVIVLCQHEYDALKHSHDLHHQHASSTSSKDSSSEENAVLSLSLSSSK